VDARVWRRGDTVGREASVRGEGRVDVARNVELGHDVDEEPPRVRYDPRELFLGGVPALAAADGAARADPREVRPRADRDAPALVVRQVEMEPVELVRGH